MPATQKKSSTSVRVSAKRTPATARKPKARYNREGRDIASLLRARIERERAAGLFNLPPGVRLVSSEVAEIETGITAGTLRKWASQGQVKYYRVGRHLRFAIDDVLARAAAPWTSGEVA